MAPPGLSQDDLDQIRERYHRFKQGDPAPVVAATLGVRKIHEPGVLVATGD